MKVTAENKEKKYLAESQRIKEELEAKNQRIKEELKVMQANEEKKQTEKRSKNAKKNQKQNDFTIFLIKNTLLFDLFF